MDAFWDNAIDISNTRKYASFMRWGEIDLFMLGLGAATVLTSAREEEPSREPRARGAERHLRTMTVHLVTSAHSFIL